MMRQSGCISWKIARHYRGMLFQSGESAATRARAASDPVPQFFDTIGYTYRTDARNAPDNLMINASGVVAAENLYSGIPTFTLPKARPDPSGGGGGTPAPVHEHSSAYAYDPGPGPYQKPEE